jgi:hypothetical protein
MDAAKAGRECAQVGPRPAVHDSRQHGEPQGIPARSPSSPVTRVPQEVQTAYRIVGYGLPQEDFDLILKVRGIRLRHVPRAI